MTRRSTAIGYVAFQTATERRTGVRLLTGAPARSHRGRGCGSSYQDSTIPTRSVRHATRIRDRVRLVNATNVGAKSCMQLSETIPAKVRKSCLTFSRNTKQKRKGSCG